MRRVSAAMGMNQVVKLSCQSQVSIATATCFHLLKLWLVHLSAPNPKPSCTQGPRSSGSSRIPYLLSSA